MEADQGEEEMLRSVALQNAKSILVARRRAEQELIESKQALEQKTEELTRANRRLTLLTRVANNFMLADRPHEHLKAAFAMAAAEIGANYYFNYSFDDGKPGLLTLGILRRARAVAGSRSSPDRDRTIGLRPGRHVAPSLGHREH